MSDLSDFLIVDDNHNDVGQLRVCLYMVAGYDSRVREAATTTAALEAVKFRRPHVVFSDHLRNTAGDNGFLTFTKLRGVGYDGPIVIVTASGDPMVRQKFLILGAIDFALKDDLDSARLAVAMRRVRDSLLPRGFV
jgi:DNA-binding NtrC family response regulator